MLARRLTAVTYRDTWTREGPAQHMLKLRASIMSLRYARDRPPRLRNLPSAGGCMTMPQKDVAPHAKQSMQHIE